MAAFLRRKRGVTVTTLISRVGSAGRVADRDGGTRRSLEAFIDIEREALRPVLRQPRHDRVDFGQCIPGQLGPVDVFSR